MTIFQDIARGTSQEVAREARLLREYGITVRDYDAMLEAQGGVCAICRGGQGRRRLAVDHDHETGAVRGLLCSRCNTGIGLFQDDPIRIERAIAYLEEHSDQESP